jgi:plastocyanin domain-containing protein
LNIKRALPLNETVVIEMTPNKTGEIAFACGMGMLHGAVVVQ